MKSFESRFENACAFLRSMFHGLHDNFQCHTFDLTPIFFFAPHQQRHEQMAVSKSKQMGAVKNFAITAAKIKIKIENNTCVGRI